MKKIRFDKKYELLRKLSNEFGISGREDDVRKIIHKEIKKYVDEIFVDKTGNLIARKKGKAPIVMLASHMDEVGIMINHITNSGKIFFATVGEYDPATLPTQRVHIGGEKCIIHGFITNEDISNDVGMENLPQINNLFIDAGLNKKELNNLGVDVGTSVSIDRKLRCLGKKEILTGKALDDRVGCYILIELAKRLKKIKNEVFLVFTVQEEIGLYGAKTSMWHVSPDWAIAVDVTNSDDRTDKEFTKKINGGPCITIKDADMLGNKCINDWIKKAAKKKKIPLQLEVSDVGTTDAMSISISKGGTPTAVVSVPIRNIHTGAEIASTKDIEHTINLLEELLKNPPKICLS